MTDIYEFLNAKSIEYDRHDHPSVFTVEDHNLVPNPPAAKTKNLFFRDQKGKRHFLIIVECDKRVDLKKLPPMLGINRISFGSPDRLKKHLGIEPGSVSLLAIVNDKENAVEVIIDEDLWQAEAFQFHPLVNTSTLVIDKAYLQSFIRSTGHDVKILGVPDQENDQRLQGPELKTETNPPLIMATR